MKKMILLALSALTVSGAVAQNWVQEQKVVASDRDASQRFGEAVAIDGDRAIVGCSKRNYEDPNSIFLFIPGVAYFYHFDNVNGWQEEQIVAETSSPEHKDDYDFFGCDVDISGNYAIIGSMQDDHDQNGLDSLDQAGSAYIYEYVAGAWVLVDKLLASDRAANMQFGRSVSISGDMAFVASFDDVYIFERGSGNYWNEIQKISVPNSFTDVSINGNFAIIGTPNDNLDENGQQAMGDAGAALIYEYDGSSWVLENKIDASNRAAGDHFGWAVDITPYYAVVGAKVKNVNGANNAGAAYVFKHNNTSWDEIEYLTTLSPRDGDEFGVDVAISGDDIVVGSYNKTEGFGASETLEGVVYYYKRLNSWQLQEEIKSPDYMHTNDLGNYFGFSVGLDQNKLIIGADLEPFDENGTDSLVASGCAYIFQYDSTVSVNELTSLDELVLYPNPTSDVITIDLGEKVDNGTVSIFNLFGQLVMSETITSGKQLNIQQLPTGTYVLEVSVGEITRKIKLVVR